MRTRAAPKRSITKKAPATASPTRRTRGASKPGVAETTRTVGSTTKTPGDSQPRDEPLVAMVPLENPDTKTQGQSAAKRLPVEVTQRSVQFFDKDKKSSVLVEQVVQAGVIPFYLNCLEQDNNPQLQFEAAWAVTNLHSSQHQNGFVAQEVGTIPILVRLLQESFSKKYQRYDGTYLYPAVAQALGEVAKDSPAGRDLVLQAGAMEHLLQGIQYSVSNVHDGDRWCVPASFALHYLCDGTPRPNFDLIRPCLIKIKEVLHSVAYYWEHHHRHGGPPWNAECVSWACKALVLIAYGPAVQIQAVVDEKMGPVLTQLIRHGAGKLPPAVEADVKRIMDAIFRHAGSVPLVV